MKFTKISVVALLLVLCLCLFAGCGEDKTTETDAITEADPVVTESDKETAGEDPVVTDPVVTDPEETDPVETDPKETDPVETDPKETDPKETDPKETDPKETEPKETDPKETVGEHVCSGVNMTTDATCYQEGSYTTVCSICGKFMGRTIFAPKLPHTPDEANPATCEKDQYCIVCQEEAGLQVVVVPAYGHEFVGAYASDSDKPTCKAEGTMTFTCVRGDNAEEHAKGTAGAAFTQPVPTIPHEFDGKTDYVAPTLTNEGHETGNCTLCGEEATNTFVPLVFEGMDDLTVGATWYDAFASSAFATDFEPTNHTNPDTSSVTIAEETEGGNRYMHVLTKNPSNGFTMKDKTGTLAYEIFTVSMDMKFSNATDSGRILSLKDSKGTEFALLSYYGGKLVFGVNKSEGIPLADQTVLCDEDGNYRWVNVVIVVDPLNNNYAFLIDGELVLVTDTNDEGKPVIFDGNGVEIKNTLSDKTPFGRKNPVGALYMFHFASLDMAIDNYLVMIPVFHTCDSTQETVESTCTKLGYTRTYCSICGVESSRVDAEKLADHQYNLEAATCTENKKCTTCGEIFEKARGHEGTTPDPLATFCTNGREYGFCTRCQTEIDEIIPAGIAETFDNFTVGKLSSTELADVSKSALSKVMTVTATAANGGFTVVEENGNRYLQKPKSDQVNLADKRGILATKKFEVSFDLRIDSLAAKENNGGVLSIREGKTDIRVLSFMGEKRLVFGKADNDIVLAKDIYKNGEADWINIRVVVDPTTFDYEIYVAGEKALYTEPILEKDGSIKTHNVYTAANNWEPVKRTQSNGNFPFPTSSTKVDNIHFFHYSNWGASFDNLTVSIVGGAGHNYEAKHADATCVQPEKDWDECVWCGDVINENTNGEPDENAHVLGEPDENTNTATCLAGGKAERHCTVDGCDYVKTVDTEKLEHRWGELEVITPATFCDAGEAIRTCLGNNTTECTESESIVIPAGIIETFENDAVGSSPTFSLLSKAFVVKKSAHTVAEDESGNKYWAKPTTRNDADLYAKTDFLSGNNFTIAFDFATIKLTNDEGKNAQGGILGLNSRAKAVYDAEGNEINFRTEGDAKSGSLDEMRILSMAQGGGINFWNINSHTATDGSSHNFRLLNTGSYLGEPFHFDIEVYPELTNGILTCIDYKIYINDKLVFESVDAGTYVSEYDGRTYPVKTIKYREYQEEDFTENTFKMATPTWLGRDTGDKDGDGDKTELIMKNKDGDLNPFYTTRAFHVGAPYVQIESIHFFHHSQITHNIDNLAVHVDAVTCQNEHKVEDSTCKNDGLEWDECIFCGKKTNESLIPADPSKHIAGDPVVDEATCKKAGSKTYSCTKCGKALPDLTEDLPVVACKSGGSVTTAASCSADGSVIASCIWCEQEIYNVTIPKLPHTFEGETTKVAASLTAEGSETGMCKVCQSEQTNILPKQAVDTFDNFTAGAVTTDVLAANSAMKDEFTYSINGTWTAVKDGDDGYIQRTSGTKLYYNSNSVMQGANTIEISFKFRMDADFKGNTIAALLSFVNGGAEMRVLNVKNNGIWFGMNANGVIHAKTLTVGEWYNIKLVLDVATFDYLLYVDDELVLFTTKDVENGGNYHLVHTLQDGKFVTDPASVKNTALHNSADRCPFIPKTEGKDFEKFYFCHTGNYSASFDNIAITVE